MIQVEIVYKIEDREIVRKIEGEYEEVLALLSEMGQLKKEGQD